MTVENDTAGTEADTQVAGGSLLTSDTGQPVGDPAEGSPADAADDNPSGEPNANPEPQSEAQGAPEEYADFSVPEGVSLNDTALASLKSVAKELNLPQEAAQKIVDIGVALQAANAEAFAANVAETQAAWVEASRTDAEFGGAAFDENIATAKRALEAYGSPALSTLLDETGLGSHPEIIRLLVKAGKTASNDRVIAGNGAASEKRSAAAVLYGTK